MKKLALLVAAAWFSAACGKVGSPQPPFIRIPEPIPNLTAVQDGYAVVLSWTNPPQYIDGSTATDLATARVLRNGLPFVSLPIAAAGQVQSYSIDISGDVGTPQTFAIQVETTRGRLSEVSNSAFVQPVDVPGPVRNLTAVVDQHRIQLSWEAPERNALLADVYLVGRQDRAAAPQAITTTRFEDAEFEAGQSYVYTVVAARGRDSSIRGVAASPLEVRAVDRTPPQPPAGLEIAGGFLKWQANSEADLEGYRIFRSARPDADFVALTEALHPTNAIFDASYQTGIYYVVSAVDVFGNESAKSAPLRAP